MRGAHFFSFRRPLFPRLCLRACGRMSPRTPLLAKSQEPPQSLSILSPNPSKEMSEQTEHVCIKVISDAVLKRTFNSNMSQSVQGLWPVGAGALQPRILKCFRASAPGVLKRGLNKQEPALSRENEQFGAVEKTRLLYSSGVRDVAQGEPRPPGEGVLLPLIYHLRWQGARHPKANGPLGPRGQGVFLGTLTICPALDLHPEFI